MFPVDLLRESPSPSPSVPRVVREDKVAVPTIIALVAKKVVQAPLSCAFGAEVDQVGVGNVVCTGSAIFDLANAMLG